MAKPTKQEIQDLRDAPKLEKAYNDALNKTGPITPQEQEIANISGGRYRTEMPGGGVAMNPRPVRGGTTYVAQEPNNAGAGRGFKNPNADGMKKGGAVRSSASRRADGIAQRGKTRA